MEDPEQSPMTKYFTGEPCRNGHISERYESNKTCVTCVKENLRKWKKANPDRHSQHTRKWYAANATVERQKRREKRSRNPDLARFLVRSWFSRHPEYVNAYGALKRSRRLQATPLWADRELIRDMYTEAKYFGMHVDHIVPLKHPLVCGLHVEHNLQLLNPLENMQKHNRFFV